MIFRTPFRHVGWAALLVAGSAFSAIAQDNEEPTVGNDLSLGEDANAAAGQPYVKETIDDWDLRCVQPADGEERCQMYQLLNDDQGTPVSEFSLFKLPEGGRASAGATVVVPLETALQQQLTIAVDSGSARRYPFAFCNPIGCYARIGLTPQDIAAFKAGAVAKISISPFVAPNEKVTVNMSLKGFTAAFNKASIIPQ